MSIIRYNIFSLIRVLNLNIKLFLINTISYINSNKNRIKLKEGVTL
jgi:hypothetical protein